MRTLLLLVLVALAALGQVACSGGISKGGTIYFQDNFERGAMSQWDFVWNDSVNFTWHASTAVVHRGSYAAAGHYRGTTHTSPYEMPSLGQVSGGSLGARTYYVKTVILQPANPKGWINMTYSTESSLAVSNGYLLHVNSPAAGQTYYYYDVYVGTASGGEVKQTSTPLAIGDAGWTESPSGLGNYGAWPSSFNTDSTTQTRQFIRYVNTPTGIGLHIFKRAYLYLATPEPGGSKLQMRKLMRSGNSTQNGVPNAWESILGGWDVDGLGMKLVYGNQGDRVPQQIAFETANKLEYDTWYYIELEEQLNDPPSESNGYVNLWVGATGETPTLWGSATNFRVRGVTDEPICAIGFGDQCQAAYGYVETMDEMRYWDDIVIADHYIGP
ncbi:MAG: hypothetical protein ABSG54_07775 [Terriglobia bacterium]